MVWGEVAKQALSTAREAYDKIVSFQAIVDMMKHQIVDFRDDTRKQLGAHEDRVEDRLRQWESRFDEKMDRVEKRQRELETRLAQVEGQVSAALAEAYVRVALHGEVKNLPPHE